MLKFFKTLEIPKIILTYQQQLKTIRKREAFPIVFNFSIQLTPATNIFLLDYTSMGLRMLECSIKCILECF